MSLARCKPGAHILKDVAATIIAGFDEAGRGAVAGPVVAAACVCEVSGVDGTPVIADSKSLTARQREDAFAFLTNHCPYGIGIVDAGVIDAAGILEATERAMHGALRELQKTMRPTYLLIDGRDHFWFDLPHSSIIRGDVSEPCIAAASILAKVTRDRLMAGFDEEFPGYGFARHKGYGTPGHLEALRRKGICPLHRRTFLHTMLRAEVPAGAFSNRAYGTIHHLDLRLLPRRA